MEKNKKLRRYKKILPKKPQIGVKYSPSDFKVGDRVLLESRLSRLSSRLSDSKLPRRVRQGVVQDTQATRTGFVPREALVILTETAYDDYGAYVIERNAGKKCRISYEFIINAYGVED